MRDVNREDEDMDAAKLAEVLAEMREEMGEEHLPEHVLVLASLGEALPAEWESHRQGCLTCVRKVAQLTAGTREHDLDDLAARIRGYGGQPAEIRLRANTEPTSPGDWSDFFSTKDGRFRYHYRRLGGHWYELEFNARDEATGEGKCTFRVQGQSYSGRWASGGVRDSGWSPLWAKVQIKLAADPRLAELDVVPEENHE
jgi:hypothetical protein